MAFTKEWLLVRRAELHEEVAKHLAELNAVLGRKAEIDDALAELAKDEDVSHD